MKLSTITSFTIFLLSVNAIPSSVDRRKPCPTCKDLVKIKVEGAYDDDPIAGAFNYIKQAGGISSQSNYPYTDSVEPCRSNQTNKAGFLTIFSQIPPKSESALTEAVATVGPIVCNMFAGTTNFATYSGSIFSDSDCDSEDLDHSVVVVGYGSEYGRDYSLVKNSWGESWSESGYFKIERGTNMCGIASKCSYPVV
ncbi:hypothetical protein BJ944DRAFT_230760 [Cunninghamella echinulata]|nr:hypothetical protein BJ944DRAFT_230760 [Cunninghamella echinulata]